MAPKEKTSLGVSVTPFLLVVHLLGLIATVLMLVWNLQYRGGLSFSAQDKQRIFNIHPVSMFIGVVFIAGEANVMYKMLPAPKETKKLVHLLLHLAALSLGILGIYAVFKFHNEIGVAHVYSLHSWMGITTFCLFGLQWLLGCLSFWYPRLSTPRREQAVPWHALMGITIFLLTICTAETGLAEKFIFQHLVREREAYLVNFLGLMEDDNQDLHGCLPPAVTLVSSTKQALYHPQCIMMSCHLLQEEKDEANMDTEFSTRRS